MTIANMPNFLLMFDWLEKTQKVTVAKEILNTFLQNRSMVTDQYNTSVHNLLLRMCNILADSIDSLSIIGKLS